MNDPATGVVKSAERTLAILELLTRHEEPLTFTAIARSLRYPRSSLHGLLRTLVERGWAEFDPDQRCYSLGLRTLEAGNAYTRTLGLVERALPLMERIRDTIDETVQLAVLDGVHNVYVAKVDGRQTLTLASEVGRRLPAHATGVGKVLLAGLRHDDLDARLSAGPLPAFTRHTVTDKARLLGQLRTVSRRGFAVDNEEYTLGIRCVAVPVYDVSRRTVAALSVSVPAIRCTPAHRENAHRLLTEAAHRLSVALGYERQHRTGPTLRSGDRP
ncbi:IclR family transcriptional regulator domain-containing protein [Actinopolymorpha rutila]|uniref:Glycerol operon regulatory protein n=1 Tax=Actinopolymorpha rutila TaxID=446787 RepID=A0A852ZI85_9ACTN|nr:DNA-binding IclR family transcriptional regulator [Actinopolymorpha rutila]